MRAVLLKFSILGALALAPSSCGSSGGGSTGSKAGDAGILSQYPADSLVSAKSASGKLEIAARTSPTQPPVSGNNSILLSIVDASTGAPVDGLVVGAAFPYMPGMKASVKPSVSAKGGGIYLLTNVDFAMAAAWQIPLTLTAGDGTEDPTVLAMDVQR